MSKPDIPEFVLAAAQRRRQKRRRRWLAFAAMVVMTMLLLVGLFFYRRHQSEQALLDAIAETHRLDPGWRLEDLAKSQSNLPAEQNAALHIMAAHDILANWKRDANDPAHFVLLPQYLLNQQAIEALRQNYEPYQAARAEAMKAIPLKTGQYPVKLPLDDLHENSLRILVMDVEMYLRGLALLQIQDGKHDDAWQTTLAILAVARSFGEQPVIDCLATRGWFRENAASGFERCLAQGALTDPMLAEAMKALAEEAMVPLCYPAFRYERARVHELLTRLDDGKLESHPFLDSDSSWQAKAQIHSEWLSAGGSFKQDHAWILRQYNELAKMPPAAWAAKREELRDKFMESPNSVFPQWHYHIIAGNLVFFEHGRDRLNTAVAGIAVERFRLKNGRWPDSLEEVVAAKLLDKVPTDVHGGKPLRFRKTSDGAVVFSVGPYGGYAGNALDACAEPGGMVLAARCEFRLWDEAKRRQPPPPAIKK